MSSQEKNDFGSFAVLAIFNAFSRDDMVDRKSTRLNSSHVSISYAVFCLKKKKNKIITNILSLINDRLATKSNQIKQHISNKTRSSLQRTFKKSFTSFSNSNINNTIDAHI